MTLTPARALVIGALTVYAAALAVPSLTRHPFAVGPAYGAAVYLFMNLVVIPLSAIRRAPVPAPVVVNGILIHMAGVGLPSALAARAAGTAEWTARRTAGA